MSDQQPDIPIFRTEADRQMARAAVLFMGSSFRIDEIDEWMGICDEYFPPHDDRECTGIEAIPTALQIQSLVDAVPMVENARTASPEEWDRIGIGEICDRSGLRKALMDAAKSISSDDHND